MLGFLTTLKVGAVARFLSTLGDVFLLTAKGGWLFFFVMKEGKKERIMGEL